MKIQNIQQPVQQTSIEAMVGSQKQEYPKPSIPVENPQDRPQIQPEKEGYNAKVNEAQNVLETTIKNTIQDTKENISEETPSLNSMQTLALQANTTQNKIDAYKAGAGIESDTDKSYIHLSDTQDRIDSQKELKTLQETYNKKQGLELYATLTGVN